MKDELPELEDITNEELDSAISEGSNALTCTVDILQRTINALNAHSRAQSERLDAHWEIIKDEQRRLDALEWEVKEHTHWTQKEIDEATTEADKISKELKWEASPERSCETCETGMERDCGEPAECDKGWAPKPAPASEHAPNCVASAGPEFKCTCKGIVNGAMKKNKASEGPKVSGQLYLPVTAGVEGPMYNGFYLQAGGKYPDKSDLVTVRPDEDLQDELEKYQRLKEKAEKELDVLQAELGEAGDLIERLAYFIPNYQDDLLRAVDTFLAKHGKEEK